MQDLHFQQRNKRQEYQQCRKEGQIGSVEERVIFSHWGYLYH